MRPTEEADNQSKHEITTRADLAKGKQFLSYHRMEPHDHPVQTHSCIGT